MRSIRDRLSLFLMLGVALVILTGGSLLYPAVRRVVVSEFDHAQLAKLHALTTLPEPERQGINLAFTSRILPEFQRAAGGEYFQVWLPNGTTLARSPSLDGAHLPQRVGSEAQPAFWDLVLPDGRPGRAVGVRFSVEGASPGTLNQSQPAREPAFTVSVVLARDTLHLHRVLRGLLVGITITAVMLLGLFALGATAAIRAGLRPLRNLADQVQAIDALSLRQRFSTNHAPTELRPIVEQLNRLMDRLAAAFERERRFTANAAHELLTPVAELRALAEAAARWSNDPEVTAGFVSDTLASARQMEHVITSLLALSRMESKLASIRIEPVDVADLLAGIRPCLAERITARGLRLDWQVPAEALVKTDAVLCRSILFNLFDNAVEYTPKGENIRCQVDGTTGGWNVVLSNPAGDLSSADVAHLFEPLWRKDGARSVRGHAGLGLAVAQAFAQALSMQLTAQLTEHHHFEVRLWIPVVISA